MLFSIMFIHSYAPDNLINIKISNLIKDQQKSLSDMSNYRPIALASLISKLLECVILQRCENNLKTSDNQFAYKVEHSTDMALFSFKQTVSIYRTKNTPIFICTMDLSKAFDRVCHKKLFEILEKRGISIYIIQLLKYWYRAQQFRVSWGNSLSSPFYTKCGIRQGSVLSAKLFAVYMDGLSDILNKESGCVIGTTKINHIFYADDLISFGPSVKCLQRLIDKSMNYIEKHYLSINASKTKIMIVKPKRYIQFGEPVFKINDEILEKVNSFKYLGMNIASDLSDDEHIISLYRGQCMRANTLLREFHMCDEKAKVNLFKSFCTSVYCLPLALNSKKESMRRLRVCYNNSLRYLMGYDSFVSISERFVRLGIPTFEELLRKNIVSLFLRIKKSQNNIVKSVFCSTEFRVSSTFKMWSEKIF